jgi:hypothetical protein
MEVSGQLHVPVPLIPGKEPPVSTGQKAERDPEPVWTLWSTEKFLTPTGNQTPAVQPLAHKLS